MKFLSILLPALLCLPVHAGSSSNQILTFKDGLSAQQVQDCLREIEWLARATGTGELAFYEQLGVLKANLSPLGVEIAAKVMCVEAVEPEVVAHANPRVGRTSSVASVGEPVLRTADNIGYVVMIDDKLSAADREALVAVIRTIANEHGNARFEYIPRFRTIVVNLTGYGQELVAALPGVAHIRPEHRDFRPSPRTGRTSCSKGLKGDQ